MTPYCFQYLIKFIMVKFFLIYYGHLYFNWIMVIFPPSLSAVWEHFIVVSGIMPTPEF